MSTSSSPSQTGGSADKAVSTSAKLPSRYATHLYREKMCSCNDSKLYKKTVQVIVDSGQEKFILHKDLLCFYSDFFRAAFNGSFKEATEGKVELPDVEVEIFEAFQVWLYSRTLYNTDDPADSAQYLDPTAPEQCHRCYVHQAGRGQQDASTRHVYRI